MYQTMNARLDAVPYVIRFNTLVPEIERCEGLPADAYADKGYCVEMPKEDVEGDVMGIVIVTNADALGLTAANPQPLGTALAAAYDPAGLYYPQRYTRFADHYGLTINPQTMTFTPESRGQFIETHQGAVSAYGSGLYFRENILNVDNYGGLSYIPTEATRVLQRFLNDLEHGIQATAVMP